MKKSGLIISLVVMLVCLLTYSSSFALSSSTVNYNLFDTGLDVGTVDVYQYDYTVNNLGTSTDPINIFIVLFDPALSVFPGDDPTFITAPGDWSFDGTPDSPTASELFFTAIPSAVILPGDSLSGFSIRFLAPNPSALGDQVFTTADLAGAQFTGATSPIPEPTSLLLLGSGLVGILGLQRKFKR